jgi:hypothetical protein
MGAVRIDRHHHRTFSTELIERQSFFFTFFLLSFVEFWRAAAETLFRVAGNQCTPSFLRCIAAPQLPECGHHKHYG